MKKLLLVTAQFPPDAAVGAMRCGAFATRLPAFGWQPLVLARVNATTAARRPTSEDTIRVERAWGGDSKRIFGIRGRYPALAALPDRHVSWLPGAVRRGRGMIRDENVDVVMTSGPPSTAHLIGLLLKKLTGKPWIADLRDPWRTLDFGRLHSAADRRLEAAAMEAANRVVASTEGIASDLLRRLGAQLAGKVHVIPNGYDEELFEKVGATEPAKGFSLLHAGSITGYRDARPLLLALRDALTQKTLPEGTCLVFLGGGDAVACAALEEEARLLQLAACVRFAPRCSQEEALAAICRSPLLVLLQSGPETDPCIPTKAFEYLRSNGRVLCLAREGSETRRFVDRWDGVYSAPADSPADIRRQIERACADWQRGALPPRAMEAYSRREATTRLAALLDELATPGAQR